jgi:hypothetical protein
MRRMILLAMVLLLATPAAAERLQPSQPAASDASSQGRPRIRVHPGRLLFRECTFRLVQEWRPTGRYVVPRQRCWWVRG